MPKTKEWSNDLRMKVIEKREAGLSFNQISNDLQITKSTVSSIWYKYRATGSVATVVRSGRPKLIT